MIMAIIFGLLTYLAPLQVARKSFHYSQKSIKTFMWVVIQMGYALLAMGRTESNQ